MKLLQGVLISLFFFTALSADTRKYASIDCQKDLRLIDTLTNPTIPLKARQKTVNVIANDPGSYCPFTLLAIVPHFLEVKDFEKAATFAIAGLFRSDIDSRISKDPSLMGNVVDIAKMNVSSWIENYVITDSDKEGWKNAYLNAFDNFEKWDRATPRNYDDCWLRPHSIRAFKDVYFETISDKEKQKIIEDFYREIAGSEDDYKDASMDNEYFFDQKSRIFYVTEDRFSFKVPQKIKPLFNHRIKEFSGQFSVSDNYDAEFSIGNCRFTFILNGEVQKPLTFEEEYARALSCLKDLSCLESNQTLEKVDFNLGFECFKKRALLKDENTPTVYNEFHIVNDQISYQFAMTCRTEDESEYIQEMLKILSSIQFY